MYGKVWIVKFSYQPEGFAMIIHDRQIQCAREEMEIILDALAILVDKCDHADEYVDYRDVNFNYSPENIDKIRAMRDCLEAHIESQYKAPKGGVVSAC